MLGFNLIHYITTAGVGDAWVANELRHVGKAGIPVVLHAMRKPPGLYHKSEWATEMARETRVIYPLPVLGLIGSVLAAPVLFGGRFFGALLNAFFGKRESFRCRVAGIAHLMVACHWARGLRGEKVTHIHSQWVHSGGTIAMYGAWLLGVPFSFTGHAADLFRERAALEDKIKRADFIICISNFHREFFLKNGAKPQQLHVMYCGIDPSVFHPQAYERASGEPFHIRSAGRLVEKKGFKYLIEACKVLVERGVKIDCLIGGSGPDEQELRGVIGRLGLEGVVELTGKAVSQEEISEFMRGGDVYCLPCVWASDNDVDGLPQMLMEAMACGLPAISTRLVGIPDLVIDGETGLLVEPNNVSELADAIERLMGDPGLASKMAQQGRRLVHDKFDIRTCLEPLLSQYRAKLGMDRGGDGDRGCGEAREIKRGVGAA